MSLVQRAGCALAVMLAACSSTPPTHFHSLVAPPVGSGVEARAIPAPAVRSEVLPVSVPVQVDVPQMVVRLSDGSMAVLEHERWIAPLGDEIRSAIALRVEQALAGAAAAGGAAADRPWRVQLDVQRFDSLLGRTASVQLQWSLQQAGAAAAVLRSQGHFEPPVPTGAAALATGHRVLFERLGDAIGRAIKAAAAGQAPACA
jgi:uncharacterized lipoprotein YmbA